MAEATKPRVKVEKKTMGRPEVYTDALGDEICTLIAEGKSLKSILESDKKFPARQTVYSWFRRHEKFLDNYMRAREDQADYYAEELMDINRKTLSGEYDAQAARLASDNLKWTAGKLKPKRYGDKIDMTTNGKDLPTPILSGIAKIDTTSDIKQES